MKEWKSKMKSFITFELPLQADFIFEQFVSSHVQYQRESPYWSTASTRQKVISAYWFGYILKHYALLIGLAAIVTLPLTNQFRVSSIFALLTTSVIVFPILYLFLIQLTCQFFFLV